MSYWIHPEALYDLESAALYFASRVRVRIADEFLAEYERVLEIVQSNLRLGTPVGG